MAFNETDLGPPVIGWLTERGWDVYQEVTGPGGRADIVAVCGRLVAVVELKKSLGLDVLEQGSRWIQYAHLVWVGIPYPRRTDAHRFACRVAEWRGFGVLHVGVSDGEVRLASPAPLHRRPLTGLRERLNPAQKTMAPAGTSRGGYWTPFKGTCQQLRDYVVINPGCSIRAAVESIDHHYSSGAGARAHLAALIEKGAVPGVTLRRDGKSCLLHPAEAA